MQSAPVPNFNVWLPAVETGVLPLRRLIEWADGEIARLDEPPRWLIEVSLATDLEALERASRYAEEASAPSPSHWFDPRRLYLGFLYLAHEVGRISLQDLLEEAGQFADGQSGRGVPEPEAFNYLLNEIDGGGPTRPSPWPLAERVRDLFEPMVEHARLAIAELP